MTGLTLADVRSQLVRPPGPLPEVRIGTDDGRFPRADNVACLLRLADGRWMTAWFERGSYHDQRFFESEDAACADFLESLGLTA